MLAQLGIVVVGEPEALPTLPMTAPDGRVAQLSAFAGKVVVLNFWATWCAPCIKEIPEYAEFYRKNQPRGIEVIGIVMDSGSPEEINDFVREYKIPYRQLVGDEKTGEDFGVNQGFPTTFVLDAQGTILTKILDAPPTKFEKLQEVVDKALAS